MIENLKNAFGEIAERFVDQMMRHKDPHGNIILYPTGSLTRGYVLTKPEDVVQIRSFLIRELHFGLKLTAGLCVGTMVLGTINNSLSILILPAALVGSLWLPLRVRRRLHQFPRTDQRLKWSMSSSIDGISALFSSRFLKIWLKVCLALLGILILVVGLIVAILLIFRPVSS